VKRITLGILITLFCVGCGRSGPRVATSPDGELEVRTEISGDEAGPTMRLCVVLIFEDSEGREKRIQTGASDTMKWALDWHDSGTLILYSSDIGTTAYDLDGLKVSERRPNEEEMNTGRKAYKERYGRLPNTQNPKDRTRRGWTTPFAALTTCHLSSFSGENE